MEAVLYNQDGQKTGNIAIPGSLFGVRWNPSVVGEVITSIQSSRRKSKASTKGRSEVRGGGKKPWRQKGTGRARHGSIRSPIWIGGGVTHGPTSEKKYSKKVNKKVRRIALGMVLSKKLSDGEVVFIDGIKFDAPKTKLASSFMGKFRTGTKLQKLGAKGGKTLILVDKPETETIRAIRNLPYINVEEARNINAERALLPKYLILTQDAVNKIAN